MLPSPAVTAPVVVIAPELLIVMPPALVAPVTVKSDTSSTRVMLLVSELEAEKLLTVLVLARTMDPRRHGHAARRN